MSRPLNIGITCYPSIGGSGIVATMLGEELAQRGHEIHFISYGRPTRLSSDRPRVHFHPVAINDYGLFKYPDYTLPLSVKMAEVSRENHLDILHVHYAVPHATAAVLACSMLPEKYRPRIVTTLHGTDTTLLGRDPAYRPAILYALQQSDAITTVSQFLKDETQRVIGYDGEIEVIPNFFRPATPARSREEVRRELGVRDEVLILHSSNLRPVKRIELLLETVACLPWNSFKLLILAGADFTPYRESVIQLGLEGSVIVRENVGSVEEYIQAADVGLITSASESFCLSILEGMSLGCPSVATAVGGIPEVVQDGATGLLAPSGDKQTLVALLQRLIQSPALREELGRAARESAQNRFSPDVIVPAYESLYGRILAR